MTDKPVDDGYPEWERRELDRARPEFEMRRRIEQEIAERMKYDGGPTTNFFSEASRVPITCGDCGTDNVWRGKLASSMTCPNCGSGNLGLTGVDLPARTAAPQLQWSGGYQDALNGEGKKKSNDWTDPDSEQYDEGYQAGSEVPGEDNTGPNADPTRKNATRGGLSAEAMRRIAGRDSMHWNKGSWAGFEGKPAEQPRESWTPEQIEDYLKGHEYGTQFRREMLGSEASLRTAAPKGYGTGWGKPHPDPLKGWASEYEGPTPQTFPRQAPVADSTTCPVCLGSGYDLIDKARCRECGGTGVITHPTDRPATLNYDATTPVEPAGGAGWRGASRGLSAEAQSRLAARPNTKDPYGPEYQMAHGAPGYRTRELTELQRGEFVPGDERTFHPKAPNRSPNLKNWTPAKPATGPYVMNQASCPACGHAPTELRPDKNEDSWWVCPHCGPLHNIDANIGTDRDVDPYRPPHGFTPDRGMKTGGFVARAFKGQPSGRLLRVLATIHSANDLGEREALEIARKTLVQYGEGR